MSNEEVAEFLVAAERVGIHVGKTGSSFVISYEAMRKLLDRVKANGIRDAAVKIHQWSRDEERDFGTLVAALNGRAACVEFGIDPE